MNALNMCAQHNLSLSDRMRIFYYIPSIYIFVLSINYRLKYQA